ncbi:hypothetical protein [Desulfofundulus thermocisternus]|uniref:hypothetical protein n=1 Tax=Desulfofundulus thermocisternus TaxID=42471 RepID=UPI0019F35617|nr:hypothetical protein [Desulfofundulus thermocisternus]MBE3586913.1 hypothetical protein [Thermoanaerobacter sp.]MCS5695395.1 hypothetical protein [Desulfofundulus thermocisternus]
MPEAQIQSYYGPTTGIGLPLVERLRQLQGQQVTVHVMHLMRPQAGTLEFTGVLHGVGVDFVELHIGNSPNPLRYAFIPVAAIGAVLVGGPLPYSPGTGVYPPYGGL